MTRVRAAARLGELLGTRAPASKWLLEQAEKGDIPMAWRFTTRRADIVTAMAQAYGRPVDVVTRARPTWLSAAPHRRRPCPHHRAPRQVPQLYPGIPSARSACSNRHTAVRVDLPLFGAVGPQPRARPSWAAVSDGIERAQPYAKSIQVCAGFGIDYPSRRCRYCVPGDLGE